MPRQIQVQEPAKSTQTMQHGWGVSHAAPLLSGHAPSGHSPIVGIFGAQRSNPTNPRGRRLRQHRAVEISAFQDLMARTYGARDSERGVPATLAWLTEELGELARAVRKGTVDEQRHELGDVLAWLASLAEQLGLSLDDAAARYAYGCPRCGSLPCDC
jgi:NTP pyrophosphatase (non-canonical NTP hydrolase)